MAETALESAAVANVVADVIRVAVPGGPEVSSVWATAVVGERIEIVLQHDSRGLWDTVETEVGDDSVTVVAAAIVCAALVTLQFGAGRAPPAA